MKTKLGLQLATDPRWVNIAEKSIEYILTDHAWCEQKAASSGISLLSRFSEFQEVVDRVSPVIAEEWGHFRKVLKELKKRGFELGPQRKDLYVNHLQEYAKRGGSKKLQLVEYLLMFAMIEARSCERFRLLSLHVEDERLKDFYHEFMVSEAGHYKLFLGLAKEYADEEYVEERWKDWLKYEAEMISKLKPRADRIH